jgi:hypothetical protein
MTWSKGLFLTVKVPGLILALECGYHNEVIHESTVFKAVVGIVS